MIPRKNYRIALLILATLVTTTAWGDSTSTAASKEVKKTSLKKAAVRFLGKSANVTRKIPGIGAVAGTVLSLLLQACGDSGGGSEVGQMPTDNGVPPASSGGGGNGAPLPCTCNITLSWDQWISNGVDANGAPVYIDSTGRVYGRPQSYNIYAKKVSDPSDPQFGADFARLDSTDYPSTSMPLNVPSPGTWELFIRAANSAGESGNSNVVQAAK